MKKRAGAAIFALVACIFVAGCGGQDDPTQTAGTGPVDAPPASAPASATSPAPGRPVGAPSALPARLDCLRDTGAAAVIAHRGGPTRDYPENALETFERTLRAGARIMEVDVTRSRDGVLFLMHDDTLERTSNGVGAAVDLDWDQIRALKLKTYSRSTDFSPPTLAAALEWAVANGVLLELDKKRSINHLDVIAAVRAAGAENNVLLITYTDDQAAEVHAAAPDLAITATIRDPAHLDRLLARGVKADRLIAWTGTDSPDPDLWRALAARGVESAFGTTGSGSDHNDRAYWADRDGAEYTGLATAGLTFVVTDRSDMVSRQLDSIAAISACGF